MSPHPHTDSTYSLLHTQTTHPTRNLTACKSASPTQRFTDRHLLSYNQHNCMTVENTSTRCNQHNCLSTLTTKTICEKKRKREGETPLHAVSLGSRPLRELIGEGGDPVVPALVPDPCARAQPASKTSRRNPNAKQTPNRYEDEGARNPNRAGR